MQVIRKWWKCSSKAVQTWISAELKDIHHFISPLRMVISLVQAFTDYLLAIKTNVNTNLCWCYNASYWFNVILNRRYFIDVPGKEKVVKKLVEYGADVNAKTDDAQTPLSFAASGGTMEPHSSDSIQASFIYLPLFSRILFCFAIKYIICWLIPFEGYDKIAEKLIKYGADVDFKDKNGITPLHQAALHGNLKHSLTHYRIFLHFPRKAVDFLKNLS